MTKKFKQMLFSEKIPTAVCFVACTASVLLGFVVGIVLFGYQENYPQYSEIIDPFRAEVAEPVIVDTYAEMPTATQKPETTQPILPTLDEETHLYVVTAQDGYIVIYHATAYGGGLKEITSTPVGTLANEELARLTEGIKIYTDEALARLLQDFGS